MAGRGPAPKPDAERRRRNAPTFEWVVLPAEGRQGPVPELPLVREWSRLVQDWWERAWTSPMATQWRDDEPSVLRLALLMDKLWADDGPTGIATEIRQLVGALGLSPKARRDLRWLIEGETPGATVTPIHAVPDEKAKRRAAVKKKV